ncbi:MAG: o-succinylbenzoate synthase [Nanoarchaeota archaeon]|nr:o-succinylbenzoate synthase [Nanoarchaeota archaeon]
MKIETIETYHVRLPLVSPFATSFGRFTEKDALIVRLVTSEGIEGFGETASLSVPLYSSDFTDSDRMVQERFLKPYLIGMEGTDITHFLKPFAPIRGHNFAKAGVEMAIFDALAKEKGMPLWQYLGGDDHDIPSGISLGIMPTIDALVKAVGDALGENYQRIKIKIKPGWDIEPVKELRRVFGNDFPLMVDANSAYSQEDMPLLRKLDGYNLLMIEQPLSNDDIYDHAKVQSQLRTPICLDESIHSVDDARYALELGSCKIINIKPGRVGGLYNSIRIHDTCYNHRDGSFTGRGMDRVPVWCGGMLETGVGRAHLLALQSLPGFTITGDTSPGKRYYSDDIVEPEIVMKKGFIEQSREPGIGYTVLMDKIKEIAL